MDIIIAKRSERYFQEVKFKENGQNIVKRTNNLSIIEETVASIPNRPRRVEISKKEARIVINSKKAIVLKDIHNNINDPLYQYVLQSIDKDVPIIQMKMDKKKLAILLLSSTLVVTSFAGLLSNNATINETEPIEQNLDYENLVNYNQDLVIDQETNTVYVPKQKPIPQYFDDIASTNEVDEIDESNFDLITRLEQSNQINSEIIPISSQLKEYEINKMVKFIESESGKYCFSCANDFGIDPYLYTALMMGESSLNHEGHIPGGKFYNNYAVGISQLESPSGNKIVAYNYTKNEEEIIYETMENALDKETNIKIGIMRFQRLLQKFDGNIYLTLQAYNYGEGLINLITAIYADEIGITKEEVLNNYQDIGWMKYIKMVHEQPNNFVENSAIDLSKYQDYQLTIAYLNNWPHKTYGNDNYIEDILSYYIGIYSKNIIDNEVCCIDLTNMEKIKIMVENLTK